MVISAGETLNLTSPNVPANYPDNADCICYIQSSTAHEATTFGANFKIHILQQIIENGYDFLTLGSGANVSEGTAVIVLSPDVFPNSVIITGPTMWLRFQTDGSSTRQGFFLQLQTTTTNPAGIYTIIVR